MAIHSAGAPVISQPHRPCGIYKPEHAVDLDTGVVVAAPIHPADEGGTTTPSRTPGISSSFRCLVRSAAKVGRSLVFMFHLSIATVWRNRRLAAEWSVTQKSSRGTHVMQYYDDKMSTSYCIYFSQNLITSDRLLA